MKDRPSLYIFACLWLLFLLTTALWSLELAQLIGLDEILLSPDGLGPDALFNRFYNLVARESKITGVLFQSQMIVGDTLVIWRVSAIWHDRRTVILIPLFWWALMIGMCRSLHHSKVTALTIVCSQPDYECLALRIRRVDDEVLDCL